MPKKITSKLFVRVTPRARHNKVERLSDTEFKIWVTAVAEKGKANEQVIKLLAKELDIAPSRLQIIRGATGKNKIVSITI